MDLFGIKINGFFNVLNVDTPIHRTSAWRIIQMTVSRPLKIQLDHPDCATGATNYFCCASHTRKNSILICGSFKYVQEVTTLTIQKNNENRSLRLHAKGKILALCLLRIIISNMLPLRQKVSDFNQYDMYVKLFSNSWNLFLVVGNKSFTICWLFEPTYSMSARIQLEANSVSCLCRLDIGIPQTQKESAKRTLLIKNMIAIPPDYDQSGSRDVLLKVYKQ